MKKKLGYSLLFLNTINNDTDCHFIKLSIYFDIQYQKLKKLLKHYSLQKYETERLMAF